MLTKQGFVRSWQRTSLCLHWPLKAGDKTWGWTYFQFITQSFWRCSWLLLFLIPVFLQSSRFVCLFLTAAIVVAYDLANWGDGRANSFRFERVRHYKYRWSSCRIEYGFQSVFLQFRTLSCLSSGNVWLKSFAKYFLDYFEVHQSVAVKLWSWCAHACRRVVLSSSAPWCSCFDSTAVFGVQLHGPESGFSQCSWFQPHAGWWQQLSSGRLSGQALQHGFLWLGDAFEPLRWSWRPWLSFCSVRDVFPVLSVYPGVKLWTPAGRIACVDAWKMWLCRGWT